jgi:hypothetical protein
VAASLSFVSLAALAALHGGGDDMTSGGYSGRGGHSSRLLLETKTFSTTSADTISSGKL